MRRIWIKRGIGVAAGALVLAALLWLAWPRPIAVDIATIANAPMQVAIDDEGKTGASSLLIAEKEWRGEVLPDAQFGCDFLIQLSRSP